MTTPTNKQLREFILSSFNEDELEMFCFDYFEGVKPYFSDGMALLEKAMELISYCKRHQMMDNLLVYLQQERTQSYQITLALWSQEITVPIELPFIPTVDKKQQGDEAQVATRYQQLLQAQAREDWLSVLTLAAQIEVLIPDYQDVADLKATVLQQLQRPTPEPQQSSGIGTNPKTESANSIDSSDNRFIHEKTGLEFVRIPVGEFLYGRDAKPVHLTEYWISKTPVTFAAYQHFIRANSNHSVPYIKEGWAEPYNWDALHRAYPAQKKDHPVVLVSWYDAIAFCNWADLQLPTEEQWEKAARGTNGLIYPWGDMWQENHCNSGEVGMDGTTPVGQFSPQGDSPYGCVDMSGNVFEWCLNKYQTPGDTNIDQSNDRRVLRGGSFNFNQDFGRATLRDNSDPSRRSNYIGFRVVMYR